MSTPWYDYNDTFHGYITQNLGPGTDTPHYANDVQTPFHTPLTSLFNGTVVKEDYAPWGGEVFIQLKNGLQEYFYHLDDIFVKVGQQVDTSTVLGLSGGENSGGDHNVPTTWSSGPHTHVGFFTDFLNGIPHGPDITPYINDAKAGQLNVGGLGTGGSTTTADPCGPMPSDYWLNPASASVWNSCKVAHALDGPNSSGSLVNDAGNAVSTDVAAASGIPQALAVLQDPHTYVRAGLVIVGLVLIVGGILLFVKDEAPPVTVAV